MLAQVATSETGKVSYEEFKTFMQEILWSESSPLGMKRELSRDMS
jgi:hypothetical protein